MDELPEPRILAVETAIISGSESQRQITLPSSIWEKISFIDIDEKLKSRYFTQWYLDKNKNYLIASDRGLKDVFAVQPIRRSKLTDVVPESKNESNSSSCRVHVPKFSNKAPELFEHIVHTDEDLVLTLQEYDYKDSINHYLILRRKDRLEAIPLPK